MTAVPVRNHNVKEKIETLSAKNRGVAAGERGVMSTEGDVTSKVDHEADRVDSLATRVGGVTPKVRTVAVRVGGVAARLGAAATRVGCVGLILSLLQVNGVSAIAEDCGICDSCTQACYAYQNDTVEIDCRKDEWTTRAGLSYTTIIGKDIQEKSCPFPDPCIISLPGTELSKKAFQGRKIHLECVVSSDHQARKTVKSKPIILNFIEEPWPKLSSPSTNLVVGERLRLICNLEKKSKASDTISRIFGKELNEKLTQKCRCQEGNQEIDKDGGNWYFQVPPETKVSRTCSCMCKKNSEFCHVVLEIDNVAETEQGNYSCTTNISSLSTFSNSTSLLLTNSTQVSVVSPNSQFCQIKVDPKVVLTPQLPCVKVNIELTPENFHAEVKINKVGDNTTILDVCNQTKKSPQKRPGPMQLENAGKYKVGCYSLEGTLIQHKNITVFIKVAPAVTTLSVPSHMKLDDIHLIDSNENPPISCQVTTSPPTTTTLSFYVCQDSQNLPLAQLPSDQTKSTVAVTAPLPFKSHGEVTCQAINEWGNDTKTLLFARVEREAWRWQDWSKDGVTLLHNSTLENHDNEQALVEHDNAVLICKAFVIQGCTKHFSLAWAKDKEGQSKAVTGGVSFSDNSATASLQLSDTSTSDAGIYRCLIYKENTSTQNDEQLNSLSQQLNSISVAVQKTVAPYFAIPTTEGYRDDIAVIDNRTYVTWTAGKQLKIECNIHGHPEPIRKWFKDGIEIKDYEEKNGIRIEGKLLVFKSVTLEESGNYSCTGRDPRSRLKENFFISSWINLKVTDIREPQTKSSDNLYIGFLLLLILLLGLVIVGWHLKSKQNKKLANQLSKATIELFEKGNIEAISKDRDVVEQADLLPYDKSIEFPFEKLQFDKMIGSGAYGKVWKGTAAGLYDYEDYTTVAIKTVNRTANMDHLQALMMELKIMQHLGKHPYVVSLLGACTVNLIRRELFMILEYCQYGSLQLYLRNNRDNYQDQIKPEDDLEMTPSQNNGGYMQMRSRSRSSADNRRTFSVALPNSVRMSIGSQDTFGMVMSNETIATTLGSMGDRRSEPSWRSSWIPDYSAAGQTVVTTIDLLTWSAQVARGMEFLGARKLLHGDLAARNVLLTSEKTVKICDFGLSRSVYKNPEYVKSTETPMPVKWMAVESIEDGIFSIQSDVWAYGITVWEIFELSKIPYGGIQVDENFITKLRDGYRLARPNYAPKPLYEVMLDCWKLDPNNRPGFAEIGDSVEQILRDMGRDQTSMAVQPGTVSSNAKDFLHLFVDPIFGTGKRSSIESQKWLLDFDQPEDNEIPPNTPLLPHPPPPPGTDYLVMRKQESIKQKSRGGSSQERSSDARSSQTRSSDARSSQTRSSDARSSQTRSSQMSGSSETRPYQRLSRNGEAYCLKDDDRDNNMLVNALKVDDRDNNMLGNILKDGDKGISFIDDVNSEDNQNIEGSEYLLMNRRLT